MRNRNRLPRARRQAGGRREAALWLTAVVCVVLALASAGYAAALAAHAARTSQASQVPQASQAVPTSQVPQASQVPRAEADFEYLPVLRRVDTQRKQIAITVDDCFQADNLRTIADTAAHSGGRLTLFPIGQNLEKPGMARLLRHCVFDLGFEVENHTWSHQRIFRLPEAEMAREIWRQGQAVNRALGVNYEQHFFRLMGGDGERDQRTHNYLGQLGFRGVASWSLSGSDADMDMIRKALRPGAVYLFHTTDADTEKLRSFIPYAVSRGYALVTLNELVGLEPNAMTRYAEQAMPAPRAYCPDLSTHKRGDYAWRVVNLQDALCRGGYLKLDGPATGYYGAQTQAAVEAFQRAAGLPVTGEADRETQCRLLGPNRF